MVRVEKSAKRWTRKSREGDADGQVRALRHDRMIGDV
jgi:hypothetical protein